MQPATYWKQVQKQPPEVFYKKDVLKNFAVFTGKYMCWSLVTLSKETHTGAFLRILRNF